MKINKEYFVLYALYKIFKKPSLIFVIFKILNWKEFIHELRVAKYYNLGCHEKLFFNNIELKPNDIFIDLGGYKGDFSYDVYNMYKSKCYIFEAVPLYADYIKNRFKNNKKIKVFNFGLSNKDEKIMFSLDEDASRLKNNDLKSNSSEDVNAELKDIYSTFKKNNLLGKEIGLMKLNIEGGEYPVLHRMIEKDLIKDVKYFAIQFHDFFDDAKKQRNEIRKSLIKTHKQIFCIPFVWEYWAKK